MASGGRSQSTVATNSFLYGERAETEADKEEWKQDMKKDKDVKSEPD